MNSSEIGMISNEEKSYLEFWTKNEYSCLGEIVDLGCWLGASSIALARGLAKNANNAARGHCIHAYDIFIWEAWMDQIVAGQPLQGKLKPGESFLQEFLSQTNPYKNRIKFYQCDLARTIWNDGCPIEFLFIDAMKSWDLAHSILRTFFPSLIPGVSVIVHQDYAFHGAYWIHLIMYRLRHYFEPAYDVPNSWSMAFKYKTAIPDTLLNESYSLALFPVEEIRDAFDYATSLLPIEKHCQIAGAKVMALLDKGEVWLARKELEKVMTDGSSYHEYKMPLGMAFPAAILDFFLRKKIKTDDTPAVEHETTAPLSETSKTSTPVMDVAFFDDTPALLGNQERLFLYALVVALKPKRVIEIGTMHGGSAKIITSGLDAIGDGRLVCVDPEPALKIDWNTIAHRATLLKGYSPGILPEAHQCAGGDFDLCFIDGWHVYTQVLADAVGVLPYMASDSYLLFHDAFHPLVREAIDDLLNHINCLSDCGIVCRYENNMPGGPWAGLRLLHILPEEEPGIYRKGVLNKLNWTKTPSIGIRQKVLDVEGLIRQNRLLEARAQLNLIQMGEQSLSVLNNMAVIEMLEERYLLAKILLEKILTIDPRNKPAQFNLENILTLDTLDAHKNKFDF